MTRIWSVLLLLAPMLALGIGAGVHVAAFAVSVTTTLDTNDACATTGAAPCSLRDAIRFADIQQGIGGTLISLPDGTYTLTQVEAGEDSALTGDLDIKADVAIDGVGAGRTIIDGNGTDRVFQVFQGYSAVMSALTIRHGSSGGTDPAIGGGILNAGALTLIGVALTDDSAIGGKGPDGTSRFGGSGLPGGIGGTALGGAIYNTGDLSATNSTFSSNQATGGDGGGGATGSTIGTNGLPGGDGGNGGSASGGALYSVGSFRLKNSTFSSNQAAGGGGGTGGMGGNAGSLPFNGGTGGSGGSGGNGTGGAIAGGGTSIANSTFVANLAIGGHGARGGDGGFGFYGMRGEGGAGGAGGSTLGGALTNTESLMLINDTIARNSMIPGVGGAGGVGTPHGSDGPGGASSGGGIANIGAQLRAINTLLAANGAPGSNCGGTITDGGHNLEFDPAATCGFIIAAQHGDPHLDALRDNGGSTQTAALLSGSAAIDAGDDDACAAMPVGGVDQRGAPRPQGMHCDIGAYEYTVITTPPPSRPGPTVSGSPAAVPPVRPGPGSIPGTPDPAPPPRP